MRNKISGLQGCGGWYPQGGRDRQGNETFKQTFL